MHTCRTHPEHDTALTYFREARNNGFGPRPDYMTEEEFKQASLEETRAALRSVLNCRGCCTAFAQDGK